MSSLIDRIAGRLPPVVLRAAERIARTASAEPVAVRAEIDLPSAPPSRRPVSAGTSTRRGNQDPARDASLDRAAGIMSRCFQGNVSEYIDLCKSTRRCDSRLNAVAMKRILAIQGRRWAIKPPPGLEGDRDAMANCLFVAQHFNETRGFASKLGHLAHAVLEGHGALQHDWRRNTRGEWATQPIEVHPRLFGWDVTTGEPGVYESTANGWSLDRLTPLCDRPGEFVFHNPSAGGSDDPWLRGALRSRILPSITKRFGTRAWLKMLERWGQPQVVLVKGDDGPSENGATEDAQWIEMLRQIGLDWRAVVPPGTDVKTIPVDIHPELHEKWVSKCDADDAIALLGQNLSTEVAGGSFAAARAHAWVLATILEADLTELAETITDFWIEPLIRFNRPGSPVPFLQMNPAPYAEITPADMGIVDASGRRAFSVDEYRASRGYDALPADVADGDVLEVETVDAPASTPDAKPPVADVIKAIELARGVGLQPTKDSVSALLGDLGITTEPVPDGAPQPKPLALAPTDIAKVVTAAEARASQGLAPFGDERDQKTIMEMGIPAPVPGAPVTAPAAPPVEGAA